MSEVNATFFERYSTLLAQQAGSSGSKDFVVRPAMGDQGPESIATHSWTADSTGMALQQWVRGLDTRYSLTVRNLENSRYLYMLLDQKELFELDIVRAGEMYKKHAQAKRLEKYVPPVIEEVEIGMVYPQAVFEDQSWKQKKLPKAAFENIRLIRELVDKAVFNPPDEIFCNFSPSSEGDVNFIFIYGDDRDGYRLKLEIDYQSKLRETLVQITIESTDDGAIMAGVHNVEFLTQPDVAFMVQKLINLNEKDS